VVGDIIDFFSQRLQFCEKEGIERQQLLLDPGIGFGKRVEDNFKIINELYKFRIFGLPIFIGLSRKSFIGKTLKVEANSRIFGAISASVIACLRGASILRVHDVKETMQALNIASHILNN
jgi:dihydropteroate synthase